MPYAEERAPSLWWYVRQPDPTWADDTPMPESQCVIDTYIRHVKRGRSLPKGFEEDLRRWLQELNREQQISPRKKRYWTLPAYALAHRLVDGQSAKSAEPPAGPGVKTFLKRFREMERIAKELFPLRVPKSRTTKVLSEEKIEDMRKRVSDGADIKTVAREFRIPPFRVGQLCREEKAQVLDAREKAREQASAGESGSPIIEDDIDTPF